jgi:DNA-binding beta-propeller fold protein YncE
LRLLPAAVFALICRYGALISGAVIIVVAASAQNFPLIPNPTPNTHYEMLYNASDGFLYTYTSATGTSTLIAQVDPKTASVLKTIPLNQFSLHNFELSPAGDYLYVRGFLFSGEAILRYHLPDFQKDAQYQLPLANAPYGLAVSPSDSHVYAVAQESFSAGHTVRLFRDGTQIGSSVSPPTPAGSLIFLSDSGCPIPDWWSW